MKKKLIALVTSLTLCAAVVVGTTLAYYSNETLEEVNTFTYSPGEDPGPEIVEPHWPEDPTITPDKVIPKDPMITLTNENPTLQYHAAMVIRGSTERDEAYIKGYLNNLKGILAEGQLTPIEKEIQATDKYGEPIPGETKKITIERDKGIAKISGWSADYDYQIDMNEFLADGTTSNPNYGTVYAYYKTLIGANPNDPTKPILITKPVFEGLKMNENINHFFDALTDTTNDSPMFDVSIRGYVVSSLNDTVIVDYDDGDRDKPIYANWTNCIEAMQTAFPDVFYADADTETPWTTANPITATYPDAGATIPDAGKMP